jgi:hypothetical protein
MTIKSIVAAIERATWNKLQAKANRKRKPYHFQARYVTMSAAQTPRHCYLHPKEAAVAWELNTQDASYKRPVCANCCA